jgi:hypothetical protein
MEQKLYSVITGDIYKSSRFVGENRTRLLNAMKKGFFNVERILGKDLILLPFDIYRGDSFQGVINQPEHALKVAVILRATIRGNFQNPLKNMPDARIAIGVGNIDYLPENRTGEGDGEAFRNSGPVLDSMNKHAQMLLINTPFEDLNDELIVECALLDAVIAKWSPEQALAVVESLNNKTQEEMAEIFNISQPAVKKRVDSASFHAVQLLIQRFENTLVRCTNNKQL